MQIYALKEERLCKEGETTVVRAVFGNRENAERKKAELEKSSGVGKTCIDTTFYRRDNYDYFYTIKQYTVEDM